MQPFFFVDTGKRFISVRFGDIIFIEANRNYSSIVTTKFTCVALVSLRQLETLLPHDHFCRVHRSYIVSIAAIHALDTNKVYLNGRELPIGETFRAGLYQRIIIASQVRFKAPVRLPDVPENYS